jgi:hypothetical protein
MYKEITFKHPQFIHQLIEHKWDRHSITMKHDSIIYINLIDGSEQFIQPILKKYCMGLELIVEWSLYYVATGDWYISAKKSNGSGERSKVYVGDIISDADLAEIHERISSLEILTSYC